MPPVMASFFADGIMAARQRQAEGAPGWEKLVGSAPLPIRKRAQALYVLTDKSNPDRDPRVRFEQSVQAVMAHGVLIGMVLAGGGFGPNEAELAASHGTMRDVWDWLAQLDSEETEG